MNVVYNSENYAIVAYPVQQGFELVDKLGGRSLFVQGSVATGLPNSVCNLRPDSRGAIHAATPDAGMAPEIQPNYVATESDRITAVESIRLVRRIVDQPALKRFSPEEFAPGPHLQSDAELAKAAGDVATTIFHPVGTAKMGTASDPAAVVDERLRVRGVGKLRVIGATVMPSITSGNTNSPTLMIAEKGAEMLLQDSRE